MKCCPACDRHLRASESHCPFCRAPNRETSAPVAVVLGLAGLLVGCSDDGLATGSGAGGSGANVTTTRTSTGQDSFTSTSDGQLDGGSFETTSVDADDSTTDSDSAGAFIYGGGADGGPEALECDVIIQDCPRGEKCMPWANDGGSAWNATRCSPVSAEPAAVGEPCTVEGSPVSGLDDCDGSSLCFHVDPELNEGTCVSFCESADPPSCAEAATACLIANDGVIALCLTPCDPKLPECDEGQVCTSANEIDVCV